MATPITWKNVPGNSSSSVDEAVQPYGILNAGLTSGFAQLSKVLDQYKKGEMGAAEDALMARLGQYATPEQMAQAQASGEITGAINNRWVDAAEATRAIDARLSGLQTQARSAQEYADYTDAVASRPHMEAISNMGARGDIAGIEAYIAENSDVRGLGAHAQNVLNSIYDTQSAQANIANSRAQAEQARLNISELERQIQNREQAENIQKDVFNRNRILSANREVYDAEEARLAEILGEYVVRNEDGAIDIDASLEANRQAVLDNARAYSEAHVSQNNWNRIRDGLNLSEQERIEQEKYLRQKAESEMSLLDRQRRMMSGIPNLEGPTPRTIDEWQGTIPELIDPISLDEDLINRYNYLKGFAGPGTDTAANQEFIASLYDADYSPSAIASALLGSGGLTSARTPVTGQDAADAAEQGAQVLANEEYLKQQDQRRVQENFTTAVQKNKILDDKKKQQATNAAMKFYNRPQTMKGSNGEDIEFYYPSEVLETVLSSLDTSGFLNLASVESQFIDALEDWRLLNTKKIMEGAYAREKVKEMEILRQKRDENQKKLQDTAASVN